MLQLCSPCCFSSMLLSMPRLNYSPYFCQSEGSFARQAWKSSNLSNFQLFLFFLIWAIKPTRGVMARRSRRQNFQQWTIFFHFPLKPNLGVNSVRVEVKSCGAKTKFGDHVMIDDHQTLCQDQEGYQQTCKKAQAYFWAQQKSAQKVKKSVNSSNHEDRTA